MNSDRKTFLQFVALVVFTATLFFVALLLGRAVGLEQHAVAATCSAAALFSTAIVAFLTFHLNRKNTQEPWLVTFRELHREFWNNEDLARVRSWLCCDEAYQTELLPVLQKRLKGQVSAEEYKTLETLDKFCALMIRVVTMQKSVMSKEQRAIFKKLNYYWWLHKTRSRPEIDQYIKVTTENLYPYVERAKFYDEADEQPV